MFGYGVVLGSVRKGSEVWTQGFETFTVEPTANQEVIGLLVQFCEPMEKVSDISTDTKIVDFVRRYAHGDKAALADINEVHCVAGRVMALNRMGKAGFIRIEDGTSDLPHPAPETLTPEGDAGGS